MTNKTPSQAMNPESACLTAHYSTPQVLTADSAVSGGTSVHKLGDKGA